MEKDDTKSISEIKFESFKPLSKIHVKLELFKLSFNRRYDKEKQSESSSTSPSLSNHGDLSTNGDSSKGERPKTNRVETSSQLPKQTIHGFNNEILFLKNFLMKQKESKEFKSLAVVGRYGVGKTALCQKVFNEQDVKGTYLPRLWVSMYIEKTKDPKVDIVKRILRSLGVEDENLARIEKEAEEEKRIKDEAGETEEVAVKEKELYRLLDVLNSNLFGKKYLIVLDGVWEDNEWNQRLDDEKNRLSCGFPKEFGGRVIVTTRDDSLAKDIVGEEENLLRLFPRSDAESVWKIYRDACDMEVNPKYPGKFKKELMDKSCGIPLAAQMLAKNKPVKLDN